MKRPTVGLIGYGRFGKLAAKYIARYAHVVVYDPARKGTRSREKIIRVASIAEAAGQDVVILAVPVSSLRNVLLSIRSHVKPGALVLDVCAVKVRPVEWMKRLLPRHVHILGTHPMFGPDSAPDSLRGHTIVVCPVRCQRRRLLQTKRVIGKAGLTLVLMTPAQHDRLVAVPLFIAQYLGRVAAQVAPSLQTATPSSKKLSEVARMAENDSSQMFCDLLRFNPFARQALVSIRQTIRGMDGMFRREKGG